MKKKIDNKKPTKYSQHLTSLKTNGYIGPRLALSGAEGLQTLLQITHQKTPRAT
jgi:hypothetical protein